MGKVYIYRPETIVERVLTAATGAAQTVNSRIPPGTYYIGLAVDATNTGTGGSATAGTVKIYALSPDNTQLSPIAFSNVKATSAVTVVTLTTNTTHKVFYERVADTTSDIPCPLTISGLQIVAANGSMTSGDRMKVDLIASRIG